MKIYIDDKDKLSSLLNTAKVYQGFRFQPDVEIIVSRDTLNEFLKGDITDNAYYLIIAKLQLFELLLAKDYDYNATIFSYDSCEHFGDIQIDDISKLLNNFNLQVKSMLIKLVDDITEKFYSSMGCTIVFKDLNEHNKRVYNYVLMLLYHSRVSKESIEYNVVWR